MNALMNLPSAVFFTGIGGNDGKKLKFSAKTLLSHFNAYIVKTNVSDTQTLILTIHDKSNKFKDDVGIWYLMGLLKFKATGASGNTYSYSIGNGDGERIINLNEAALIRIIYSSGKPSGQDITHNTIQGNALISGEGIPNGFELNVNENAGNKRYAQFMVDNIQDKVNVLFLDGDGQCHGVYNSSNTSDNLWVDLRAFSKGFYILTFVQKDFDPDDNPDPDYPYTFNVGDPKYDGTIKYEEE